MKAGGSGASSEDGTGPETGPSGGEPPEAGTPEKERSRERASGAKSGRSITELELAFAESPGSSVYIELCHAYLEKRRFMEAMVVCKKAARTHPEALTPKLLLARVHEAQGRLPKARDVLEGLVREHPDEPEVLTAQGRLHLAASEEGEGIALLKRALDLDPAQPEASALLAERGITYPEPPPAPEPAPYAPGGPSADLAMGGPPLAPTGDLGLPPGGVPVAGAPSAFAPDASGVYRMAPQRLEGEDELERLAVEVAEEQPTRGRARTTLVLVAALVITSALVVFFRFTNKARLEAIDELSTEAVTAFDRDLYASYKKAADALEDIIDEHDADHAKTLARLAHVYAILVTEHLEKSARPRLDEVLPRALEHAEQNPHAIAARGLVRLHTGEDRSESARAAAEILAPAAAPDQTSVPTFVDLALGIAELELGEVDRAQQRIRRVAEFMGNNVRARIWAARAAASSGRLATAQRYYVQARKAEPRHPGAIAGLALITLARGDLEGARQALELFEALESEGSRDISPKDRALAIFAKSELHRRDGQEDPADVEYERAVKLDPENADFPFQRGRGLLQSDRLGAAIEYLRTAVEMEPSRWTFRLELAEALMLAKKMDEAKEHLDFALEKAGDELAANLARARYLRRTDAPEAEAFLTETLSERFPGAKVELGLELGRYYRAKGDLEKADEHLGEAIKAFGGRSQALQADVLVSFGLVASDADRKEEAVKAYRAAARRGNLDALALLASALQTGTAEEREEALDAARRYLAAGKRLRRTEFVQSIVERLEGS